MDFSTGSALRFGWETLKKRPWFFIGSTVVILLASGLINAFTTAIDGAMGGSVEEPSIVGIVINLGLGTLLSMGATAFYLAAHDNPETVDLTTLWHPHPFLNYLGASILFGLAVAAGFVLLVVPGVMLACAWCVAAPSLVADRTGIFAAFGRSADLTRGSRWQIFGLIVIVVVVEWIISMIFNAITGVGSVGMGGDPLAVAEAALSPLALGLGVIRQTIGAVIGATAAAVIYVELRRAREGEGPEWLTDIFR